MPGYIEAGAMNQERQDPNSRIGERHPVFQEAADCSYCYQEQASKEVPMLDTVTASA